VGSMGIRFAVAAWLAAALALPCQAAKNPVTIEALVNNKPSLAGHAAGAITWSPDGSRLALNDDGKLVVYTISSGQQTELADVRKLEEAATRQTASPSFDWTNRNVGESTVQWFHDGKHLLVAAAGDLFVVDASKGSFENVTQTPETEADPKLSPDNKFVSFRRGSDLYAMEVGTRHVTRLTGDGTETLLNGQLDWVYPEELDLGTAHWWSPDSRSIAYLQFDVSREPVYPQISLLGTRALVEPERYPKAGDPNAEVRLGIVAVEGGATKWMELGDPRDALLARVAWSPTSRQIMAERLNRVQNRLDLLLADVDTGAAHAVLHEEDKFWINVKDGPRFLGKGDRFLWTSERSGFRHLYVYGTDGTLVKELTSGDWEVDEIAGVDEKRGQIYFTSSEGDPLGRQFFSVGVDGGERRRVSRGEGSHGISLAPGSANFMDDFSSLSTPPRSTICNLDGSALRVFRQPETAVWDAYELQRPEIVKVKTQDGTLLYARMMKPAGFQPGRQYPAIVMVYGGPGAQAIHDTWSGLSWEQVLAQKGFVSWQLDNRGSAGRGHAFESVIYHDLGEHELADQREGIAYLVSQGFVDPARIGMYGWSYGGFMTLYSVTHAPGLIKAAISGAPVTDFRNYDTIYTERYMGLPGEDPEGYKRSSPQSAAGNLAGTKLLIIHNIEDDNVHFQNTLQMANALELAGKEFSMVVYPLKTHGVTGAARKHLLEETTAFFEENLK
jgi:dipeptidyl-peptidase 4